MAAARFKAAAYSIVRRLFWAALPALPSGRCPGLRRRWLLHAPEHYCWGLFARTIPLGHKTLAAYRGVLDLD